VPISFAGKGTPITAVDFQNAVAALGGDSATLWSLVVVETNGFGFFADRRPQILFERHIFQARTGGSYSAAHPDISNPQPGGYAVGAAEYDRLARAMLLDERAALESTSWGLGQVMGFNATSVGYADVYAMVSAMVAGEGAQLQAVAQFIAGNPALSRAVTARDWANVALHYNGPNYSENKYDEKLAANYQKFSNASNRPNIDARTAQACLLYLGYLQSVSDVDGLIGPHSLSAIQAFRQANGMPAGGLDAALLTALSAQANI